MGNMPPSEPGASGAGSGPDWGEMKGKLQAARGADRMILIAGIVFFVDSFLPWYGVSLNARVIRLTFSLNAKGWSSGGLAVLAILLAIGATALAIVEIVGKADTMNIPAGTLSLSLCGGAFAFALLRWLTQTRYAKYGLFVAIILGAVMTFAAYQKFQTSKS
jgi:hypothetical protein